VAGNVERDDRVAEDELDVVARVEVVVTERQIVGADPVEDRREVHPVVGPAALLADDDEGTDAALDGCFDEAVTDHPVADDEDRRAIEGDISGHGQTPSRRCAEGRT
jgi:hypothetical protein